MSRNLLLTLALILSGLATASAQLVVETRPEAPQHRKQLDAPKDDSYVFLPPEWAVKGGQYVYVQSRYAKQQPGLKYSPGKWKKVSGGWVWRPGSWK